MKRATTTFFGAALLLASASGAHDMFLKLESHFFEPGSDVTIALINGTYDRSENAIARDRMIDVRVVGPESEVASPPVSDWWDDETTTWLAVEAGAPGTYAMGVSTRARTIDLAAADFNEYLEHDGVLDMLAARERDGKLAQDASELYSKHVKTIYQVGDATTGAWAERFGYPIEIVPLRNPYELGAGDRFEFVVLRDGEPAPGQLVYASHAGHHRHDEGGGHAEAVSTRTADDGVAGFELTTAGRWYVRLIHMVERTEEKTTHESNWATLTFEIAE